jgi:hypothetical protein
MCTYSNVLARSNIDDRQNNLQNATNGSVDEFSTSTSKPQPSQGLYALLFTREEVGVRSLSARSFKIRHGR